MSPNSTQITVCEFNLENLFLSMAYYEGQDLKEVSEREWRSFALSQLRRKQKPLWRTWGVAEAILDIDADVFMLVEVGGAESLENFNRHFLGERYEAHFVEGNARRGIDLGFLVKRGFPFQIEAVSNRDTPVEVTDLKGKRQVRFSRDVAELRVSDESGMRLLLLLSHLKSTISTDEDYLGRDLRTAEAAALAELYKAKRIAHPDAPVVVGGDFNAAIDSLELEFLRRTDLTDFHDIIGTPETGRVSLVHFDYAGNPHPAVLDYLLVSPQLRDRVVKERSFTYRYKGFYGEPQGLPGAPRERFQMPSDHYPLVLTLRI